MWLARLASGNASMMSLSLKHNAISKYWSIASNLANNMDSAKQSYTK